MRLNNKLYLVVIAVVAVTTYQVFQFQQERNKAKDDKILRLLKEIALKDQAISDLHDQLDKITDLVARDLTDSDSLAKSNNIKIDRTVDGTVNSPLNPNQSIQTTNQVIQIKSELEELSSALEKKDALLRNINRLGPFSRVNVTEDNREDYFQRLIEISDGNLYNTEYLVNPDIYGELAFDESDSAPLDGKDIFDVENNRLYAHFQLQDYLYDQVLVKWYKEGGMEPIKLDYFDINQYGSENYIWIEPSSNWQSGRYFVEVFSASEFPELLSAGSYLVGN